MYKLEGKNKKKSVQKQIIATTAGAFKQVNLSPISYLQKSLSVPLVPRPPYTKTSPPQTQTECLLRAQGMPRLAGKTGLHR